MRVLISGAGIAGPTLAYFLARAGAQVTVVEKAPKLLAYGQNIDIRGSAVSVVRKMGLLDEVRRLNTTEKGTQFVDPNGRIFARFPMVQGAASMTSEFEILRGDLSVLLCNASRDEPNVTYRFGTTVSKVVSNDDEAVKVQLNDGSEDKYDLLCIADGQWSRLRKDVFPSDSVTVVHKNAYVAYYTIPRTERDNDWWNLYCALGSRNVSTRPDPHGTIRACLSIMPNTPGQASAMEHAARGGREAQEALMKREFADVGWETPRLLEGMEKAEDFYMHAIQQIKMDAWSSGRVVCLGDTAFCPTPLTGMGTSLALDGAYLLAGELSQLAEGEHPARALEAYERNFRPFVEKIQKIPSFVPAVVHPAGPVKRYLLQTVVAAAARIAAIPWPSWLLSKSGSEEQKDIPLPTYNKLETRQ